MTRAEQIYRDFEQFDTNNPEVWELFRKYVVMIIKKDFTHYGASAVFERIRWHVQIETTGKEFKLNNNYCAHYARKFEDQYPDYAGFFRVRRLVSENQRPK
tara:strand:- start:41 stop:343 length:303 start_codon:yes stop_codon:yes gene_type:complete